jgi:hypothetical protein
MFSATSLPLTPAAVKEFRAYRSGYAQGKKPDRNLGMLGLASYPDDDKEAQVTQKKTGGSLG